jgi:radical SAM superfamily enzyme YgiQ (UPF0313 family)
MTQKTALVTIHVEQNNLSFPLAAAQLKAALPHDLKEKTDLVNFTLEDTPEKISRELLSSGYRNIGFSCYIWNVELIEKSARLIREASQEILMLAGGPHVSADREILKIDGLMDYLIINEGEGVLEKVLRAHRSDKTQIIEGEQVNLETLASPFLTGIIDPAGYRGILWELSRGCPYNCAFCYESRDRGKVRRFSMDRLKKELDFFIETGVQDIWILDSTFNHNKAWCLKFLKMLTKKAPHIHFTFEIRAENVTKEQAELFGQITASLQIGLQSTNKKVMAGLNRDFNPVEFRKKIKLLERNFLVYGFDLIYGLPGDTLESFKKSLDYTLNLSPSNIDIFPLSLLPGTQLADQMETLGLDHDKTPQRLITGRPGFTTDDLKEAARLTDLCNLFYTRGLASMWFSTACKALELSPSVFLDRFGIWMDQEGHDLEEAMKSDPASLQRGFLKFSFSWRSKEELYLPLNSFIIWHEALNRLMEGEDEVIVELTNDPESLTQLELVGLEDFNEFFPSHKQSWRIYTEDDGIYWEPV